MIGVFDSDQVRLTEDLIIEIEKLKTPVFTFIDEFTKGEHHNPENRELSEESLRVLDRLGSSTPRRPIITQSVDDLPEEYRNASLPDIIKIAVDDDSNVDRGTPLGFERE